MSMHNARLAQLNKGMGFEQELREFSMKAYR
jgi:hypothetical protein